MSCGGLSWGGGGIVESWDGDVRADVGGWVERFVFEGCEGCLVSEVEGGDKGVEVG